MNRSADDKPFAKEGYEVMAAAFEVHNTLRGGLSEEICQQSLEIELTLRNVPFLSKNELAVFYKGRMLETRYKPDLVVLHSVVVELKALSALVPEHEGQLFNYLRIARRPVGYPDQLWSAGKTGMEEVRSF